jgi:hypothetical protein
MIYVSINGSKPQHVAAAMFGRFFFDWLADANYLFEIELASGPSQATRFSGVTTAVWKRHYAIGGLEQVEKHAPRVTFTFRLQQATEAEHRAVLMTMIAGWQDCESTIPDDT